MRNDRWMIAALAVCLAGSARAEGRVASVSAKQSGTRTEVHVKGSNLSIPRVRTMLNGSLLTLEFDAKLNGRAKTTKYQFEALKRVRVGWRSARPPRVRVDMRVPKGTKPVLMSDASGWRVALGPKSAASAKIDREVAQAEPLIAGLTVGVRTPLPNTITPNTLAVALPVRLPSAAPPPPKPEDTRVSLDFVNTEIVQILKALALQTGVNVVTAPEVKGTLTVSLHDVTVDSALRFVTSLSGIDYARVGDTYVVAPAAQLRAIKRQLTGEEEAQPDLPVVATYQVYGTPAEGLVSAVAGKAESGKPSVVGGVTLTYTTSSGSKGGGDDKEKGADKGSNPLGKLENPEGIVLRGPAREVQNLIKLFDQLTEKFVTYFVTEGSAADLVSALAGKADLGPEVTVEGVTLTYTPKLKDSDAPRPASELIQRITLRGPGHSVTEMVALFDTLAQRGLAGTDSRKLDILEVRHVQPTTLRDQLKAAIPGLSVIVAPAAAANPRAGAASKEGIDSGAGGKEGGGVQKEDAGLSAKAAEDVRETRNARGLTLPFSEFEPTGVPMRIVLRGTPDQIRLAREYASKVDVAPKQIAIELRVMEMNKEEAEKVGIDWSIFSANGMVKLVQFNHGFGDANTTNGTVSGGTFNPNYPGTPDIVGKETGPFNVLATLDAIANRNNLIARPNLLAIDGRESELFVGDVIRYIKSIQATQNGITIITDEERVGVRLSVFPRIGVDGKIALDLRPVLSYLRGYVAVPGGGQLPQTSERITQTSASINSGDTIAIGGLILDQDRRNVSGTPLLKDLPIIGALFRRTDKSKARTEVVFFLTAKVVDEETKADAARPKAEDPMAKKKKG